MLLVVKYHTYVRCPSKNASKLNMSVKLPLKSSSEGCSSEELAVT